MLSIHAPTRGATIQCDENQRLTIFQSTLLQEERPDPIAWDKANSYLSIHAPTRGATYLQPIDHHKLKLSIHAPTRGATVKNLHLFIDIITFKPRSYKRSDIIFVGLVIVLISFNPRSYKRSDSHLHPLFLHPHTFNPRSYKRSDDNGITFWKSASLSIHAPTRGATINFPFE